MKNILHFVLAGVICLEAGLPVFAQDSNNTDQAFAKYDADRNGKLSTAEFSKVTTPDGKKASIQEWDADGDGFISKAEFAAKYSAEDGAGSQDRQPSQPRLERLCR